MSEKNFNEQVQELREKTEESKRLDNEIKKINEEMKTDEVKEPVKICIGIPHTGLFDWHTTMSLLSLKVPSGYKIVYHLVGSCLVYDAREKIIEFARKEKCKYTLMLDSDMVPPSDMIMKFISLLENKPDIAIVTGMAFKRTPPFQPCFYTKLDYDLQTQRPRLESPVEFPKTGFIALQGCGMSNCMIRTSIFDEIDKFKSKELKGYFFPLPNLGEDLTFCLLARKVGHIILDLSIDVGHISAMPITSDHFKACYEEHKRKNMKTPIFDEEIAEIPNTKVELDAKVGEQK